MGKKYFFFIILVCLAFLARGGSPGQEAFITVTDKKSHEPVQFAHVRFEGLKSGISKYALTSVEGKVPNEAKELSRITITYMGYATLTDTIGPGQSLNIQLKPTVLSMDEVVVTAQYTPEKADKSIYPVEVINSREIELKAATTMTDLLKNEVSMRVSQDGVLGTSLTMQGMSGQNVKFLVDGVPMIGRMNGNINLNQINLFNVDHVEVIEGPMSVIYGSNALAGVINVITKENKTSAFSGTVNTYAESVGVYNLDGAVSANMKNHQFSLDGGRNFFGGYSYHPSGRSYDFLPYRQYFIDGYYIFSKRDLKIKTSGQYFNELLIDKGDLLPHYYETAFDAYFTTVRYAAKIEGSYKLKKLHYLNIIGSYSGYERIKKTYFKNLTTMEENLTSNPEDHDTTGIFSWLGRATFAKSNPDKKLNYQAGLDVNIESGTGKRILDNRQSLGDYAAFLSLKWDIVRQLSFQPGIRLIYNTKYNAPVVYAMSARWNIVKPLVMRLSFARGFRAPDIKELYLFFKDVNHDIQGNPGLNAETSMNMNADINYSAESGSLAWNASMTGFYNIIDHMITLAQSGTTLYTYVNIDKYKTLGLQFASSFKVYPALTVEAGFSETGRYNSLNEEDVQPTSFYFSPDANLNILYRFTKPGLTLSLFYKYTGKLPQPIIENGVLKVGYLGAYNTMDFTASQPFFKNSLVVSGGLKNIFDNKTIPSAGEAGGAVHGGGGDNMPISWGRTVFLKLSYTFNKSK